MIRLLGRREDRTSRRIGEPIAQVPRMAAIDDTANAAELFSGIPEDCRNVRKPRSTAAAGGECVDAQIESAPAHQNLGATCAAQFTDRQGITHVRHGCEASRQLTGKGGPKGFGLADGAGEKPFLRCEPEEGAIFASACRLGRRER